jgi:cysteine synthase A
MRVQHILELIGNTPVVRINRLFGQEMEVWVKLERQNPGASIKDRIALAMIEEAEKQGLLNEESIIIEPTSGNTGIGLALVCAVKGYRLILVMPESMSVERRKQMQAYGAELVLTPKDGGMKAAIEKANALREAHQGWIPMQFENPVNPRTHETHTAAEILSDFPEGIDYLITGVGTGGHISGVGRVLKTRWPEMQVMAVEPEESPVISGGKPGPHGIQGIGAGFIPENLALDVLDGSIAVPRHEALHFAREAARQEGLFIGISSGASLAAIHQYRAKLTGKRVLSFAYDSGERYISVADFFA